MSKRLPVDVLRATACAALLLPIAWLAPMCATATTQSQAEDARQFKAVMELRGETAVPVKFVMSVSSGGAEQQQEGQTQGTLVSADGLILVPGRVVSIDLGALSRGGGLGGTVGSLGSAKSRQFRVRLPSSDEWVPADLVTRDTELGIAWIRLRHPKGKLAWVNFSEPAKVVLGTQLFTVMRTSDQFGAVPVIRAGYVLGETAMPRHEWLVDGSPGVAFDGDGKPAGYVDVDLAGLMRSRGSSGGIGMDMADSVYTMIPAERIGRVTARAALLPVVPPADGDGDQDVLPPAPPKRDRLKPATVPVEPVPPAPPAAASAKPGG
ncbi:MAG: hypothetical protein JSS44_02815 [Proteobacteria bacterium]|nr:hypothetical protein [Pseudomonadota bacterium]MBS0464852.1 hypothetical protein [Pseudomonadota bacterium]